MANETDYFGEYSPHVPLRAAEYDYSELEKLEDPTKNGPLDFKSEFSVKDFKPLTAQ